MTHGSAIMPDALRWLWRDYAANPVISARQPEAMGQPGWDPRAQVYSVIIPGKPWEPIAGAYQSITGLAAGRDGRVYFSDAAAMRIYQADAEGKVTVFREKTAGASALRFGPDGRLHAAQPALHRIVSFGEAGGDEKVLARNIDATDLAITAKGALYFIDAATKKSVGLLGKGTVATLEHPMEALALSPDQSLLTAAGPHSRFNWSFQIAQDGALVNGEPFFRVDLAEATTRGSAGVTVDSIGQTYFATALGIQLCEQNGRCAAILSKPEPSGTLSAIAFGGKDLAWLYAVQGNKLFRRAVKTRGVDAASPVTPPRPPL